MNSERALRRPVAIVLSLPALLLWLSLAENKALARGGSQGLHWGYHPPAGNPFVNIWRFTNPWSAMSGGGIIHHSTGPANLNMGGPTSSSRGTYGSFGRSGGVPPTNRSVMFPGASSQTSSSLSRPSMSGGYAAPRYSAPTGGPYLTEDRFNPPYYHSYNGYWHHGYWGGRLWGWARWDRELGVWSFPRWGLGPLYFTSGYGAYHNPFVSDDERQKAYATVIKIEVEGHVEASATDDKPSTAATEQTLETIRSQVLKSPEVTAGLKAFDTAREAFRKRDYPLALRKVDESLKSLPHDPALHEFRGLVLFAQGDYRQAAAVIYDVLAVSPGWDWTTLIGFYAEHDQYTEQLRKLETHRKQNPEAADATFLVAYHYATCGHHASALKHVRNVSRLLPLDNFAPHLATLLADASDEGVPESSSDEPVAATDPVSSGTADEASAPLDATNLTGQWNATRGADARIELIFNAGSKFTWVIEAAGQRTRFEGTCVVVGDQLILSCAEGTMIGVVTSRSLGGNFNFRLLENAPSERGLDFDR